MMEKLGTPQTHLALKAMIREVDEDGDNRISFREVRRCIRNRSSYYLVHCQYYSGTIAQPQGQQYRRK